NVDLTRVSRMSQLKIREMPRDERPREKLLMRGPDALTNPELIAILLRTGRRGMNVVEVARELLDKYKSFAELSRCSVQELLQIKLLDHIIIGAPADGSPGYFSFKEAGVL